MYIILSELAPDTGIIPKCRQQDVPFETPHRYNNLAYKILNIRSTYDIISN